MAFKKEKTKLHFRMRTNGSWIIVQEKNTNKAITIYDEKIETLDINDNYFD